MTWHLLTIAYICSMSQVHSIIQKHVYCFIFEHTKMVVYILKKIIHLENVYVTLCITNLEIEGQDNINLIN